MDASEDPFIAVVREAGRHHQIICPGSVTVEWAKQREADPDAVVCARSTLYRHLRAAGHEPRHAGVWLPAGLRSDPVRDAAAVYDAIGDPMAFTGEWALWANRVCNRPPSCPTVVVPANRTLTVGGCRIRRTRTFDAVTTRRIHGVPTAAVPRATADYAGEGAGLRDVSQAMVEADRLRRCGLADMHAELARRQRFPGRATFARACANLDEELSHSAVEGQARRRLRRLDPAFTSRPYAIHHDGRVLAEVDTAVVELCYGVEVDGPFHLWPARQIADRERDQQLGSIGWTIDRFWWFEVEDDVDAVAERVTARLRSLGWQPRGR